MSNRRRVVEEVRSFLGNNVVEEKNEAIDDWMIEFINVDKYVNALRTWVDQLQGKKGPEEINWTDVGNLGKVRSDLKELIDFLNIRIR